MNINCELREKLDNAICEYIKVVGGKDSDDVDYGELDEWLETVTGVSNPLEEL